jgi:hypothetical protein
LKREPSTHKRARIASTGVDKTTTLNLRFTFARDRLEDFREHLMKSTNKQNRDVNQTSLSKQFNQAKRFRCTKIGGSSVNSKNIKKQFKDYRH